ncbi:conserved exported hypothetical protein [Candidatus Sulfopaludibacter sp. SbA3]|nr:conserved exported hypothetical protein [Candidatus Sulfopaludibacter sp. SbA3]
MKTRLFAGVLGACLLLAPLSAADDAKAKQNTAKPKAARSTQDSDMQLAIAFERYKDLAAARQARLEARHPTVFYNNADRTSDKDDTTQGKKVIPKDK